MTRRLIVLAALGWLALAPGGSAAAPEAGSLDPELQELVQEWDEILYEAPEEAREARLEALTRAAEALRGRRPGRAEPLVWEAIVRSSYAGAMGGVRSLYAALPQVKQARDLLFQAARIDAGALDGSIYTTLGSLYYQVPGWPLGFGDETRAREYLAKGLEVAPDGIDANYFMGDFLLQQGDLDGARRHLEKALDAPPRPGRKTGDAGRRKEARLLLATLPASPGS